MDVRYSIIDGPDRLAIIMSMFSRQLFTFDVVIEGNSIVRRILLSVDGIKLISTGVKDLQLEGVCGTHRVNGYYDTKNKRGHFNFPEGFNSWYEGPLYKF